MPCDDMSRRGLFIAAVRRVEAVVMELPRTLKGGGVPRSWNPCQWVLFFLEHLCDFLPFLVIVVLLLRPCQA